MTPKLLLQIYLVVVVYDFIQTLIVKPLADVATQKIKEWWKEQRNAESQNRG